MLVCKWTYWVLGVLFLCLSAGSIATAQPVEIKQALKVGNKYEIRLSLDQTVRLPIGDEETTATSRVVADFSLSVFPHQTLTEQDGGKRVLMKYDRIATPAEPGMPKSWLVSYSPVKAEAGEVIGVSTVVQDITRRKRAERARLPPRERSYRGPRVPRGTARPE